MSSRIEPRRRAQRPPRRGVVARRTQRERPARERPARTARTAHTAHTARLRALGPRLATALWVVPALAGVVALCLAMARIGPSWMPGVAAVVVGTSYTWALCARTGGRPVVYSLLALAFGALTLGLDRDLLRGGAAVLTAVVAAVLAVVTTVPAARFAGVVREVAVAVVVASGGALAVAGLEPRVALQRFEYTTFGLGVLLALLIVFRLGAGWHGLGRRGLLTVVVGSLLLVAVLVYAETLRRYGSPGLVQLIDDATTWSHDHLGAVPRPTQFVLGIPALAWGVHMRARRRQGWWVCAYGTAGTVSIAATLVRPHDSLLSAGLTDAYGVVLGLLFGYLVIRLDLALTGPRGSRARRAEEERAVRPEPARTAALL